MTLGMTKPAIAKRARRAKVSISIRPDTLEMLKHAAQVEGLPLSRMAERAIQAVCSVIKPAEVKRGAR